MKKLISLIVSLALIITLTLPLSGCTLLLIRQSNAEHEQREAQNASWVRAQDWSDDYAITYEDSHAKNIPSTRYKNRDFTIKSPLEKGGFYEKGYDYTFGYQITDGVYYVNTMKYKEGCDDDDPVTVYILRVDPPFIGDEYDVVYEYQTTYKNKCIYNDVMGKYLVREYPGVLHFINVETKEVSAFGLDTGVHLFSVAYGNGYYLETWYDEDQMTVSFKVYDYDLNVYTTSAYDIGWYVGEREDHRLYASYNFNVYGDYVIYGFPNRNTPARSRLVNYKTDELVDDEQIKQDALDAVYEQRYYDGSKAYRAARTVEIYGIRGYIIVSAGALKLCDFNEETGKYNVLWEKPLSEIPALGVFYDRLAPLSSEDIDFKDGQLFFALYADEHPAFSLPTSRHEVPTMVFRYDLTSGDVEYIGYLSADLHDDILGVYEVPNKEDFADSAASE